MADRNNTYLYGTAAPKQVPEMPQRAPRRQSDIEKRKIERQQQEIEQNRARATRIGGLFTMLVVAAMAVLLFTCSGYISLINAGTSNEKKINSLQSELEDLKNANDQRQLAIDTSINYEYIYRVATEELGMVYANPDQIVNYESGESSYVIQFSDVPSK